MRRPFLAALLAPAVLAACGYRSREQSITAADLRVPERTRITNYMSAPIRPGQPAEEAPGSISRSVLLDEARIASVDGEVCFDVVVRTASSLDTALSEMRLLVDGQPARVGDEVVSVHDYPFTGERDLLVAEHVSREAFASLRLTAPTERVFRVIERRGRVCRTMPLPAPAHALALEVIIVEDDNRGNWGERFAWTID